MKPTEQLAAQVVADFGRQHVHYPDNDGYFGSSEFFRDTVEPLMTEADFRGAHVAEIGAGSGRIVQMLLAAGTAKVFALEPGDGVELIRKNYHNDPRVECVRATGEFLPDRQFDIVLSIGVLHHIPDPIPAVRAAYRALRPGGRMLVWLYGWEGNELYLAFILPLRRITRRLPHRVNVGLAWLLQFPLAAYIGLSRILPVPMHRYMVEVTGKLTADKRRHQIYDQLNPEWAKYYRRDEVERLMRDAGFSNIQVHHRHGYSWTATGVKPT